ncbi:hypothetical protein DL765_011770 [Monosporascus sp. GIB2]|nr:hypothetical protein DL765_011770 [Monosporascus sp. GIB2]
MNDGGNAAKRRAKHCEDEADSQHASHHAQKRPRLAQSETNHCPERMRQLPAKFSPDDYTIGWVCALPTELAAAKAMLDHVHAILPNDPNDGNSYTLGAIHGHNVVMACLPSDNYGTNNAAFVANNMRRSYPSIRVQLVVGIGGGVPGQADVRLGDVVVGHVVVQHDLRRTMGNGKSELVGTPCKPPSELLAAIAKLRAEHETRPSRIPSILAEMLERYPTMTRYTNANDGLQDWLYDSTYDHAESIGSCSGCDSSKRLVRPFRRNADPYIHYGTIASGNQVIKHAQERDKLVGALKQALRTLPPILCVEMEAAGLMNSMPCLVIRGICDYADSHKNKQWQPYAAATAAAYAKELLSVIPQREFQNPSPPSLDRRKELLDSLLFERIDSRHEEIRDAHTQTCEWLLQDPQYLDWLDPRKYSQHHGFLWIKGKPGSGKSTLMKFLLGNAKTTAAGRNAVNLAFFFNARGGDLEKSTVGMYRSLISQLLERVPELQDVLDDLPRGLLEGVDTHWDLGTVRKLLFKTIPKLGSRRLTFFIDALDECDDSQVRDMIIDFENLGNVAVQCATQFYVCFSSRHYPYIPIETGVQFTLEDQVGHTEDLEKYIRRKLRIGATKAAKNTKQDIIARAGGVFLWVVLVIPILQKEFDKGRIDRVKTRLRELPPELSGLFRAILRRDSDDLDSLLLCLQWILYARHPLKPEEFYYAALSGLNPEPDSLSEWDPGYITLDIIKRFVWGSSKGLAEMTKSKHPTVQFIHESVRDFLIKDNGLRELFPELEQNFEISCHNRLKQCCQTYIIKVDVSAYIRFTDTLPAASSKEAKELRQKISNKFPFLKYAVHQILYHADAAAITQPQESFLQKLDLSYWINLRNAFETVPARCYTSSASRQYILAENNLSRLLSAALKIDPTTDVEGERYLFPLFTAVVNGNEDSVKLLVENGANIEVRDKQRRTALHLAAERGHYGIAQILVEGKADVNARRGRHGNPLYTASVGGHDKIVALLLEGGAGVNAQGEYYGNALQAASVGGHDKIVTLLLEKGADVNAQGGRYGNALQAASALGHDKIVALLLEGGADVNAQGGPYGNSLQAASAEGHDKVVALLLDWGAQTEVADDEGWTPLLRAVVKGREAVVRLLLDRGAQTGVTDKEGRTPLLWAITKGHEAIVRLLQVHIA